MEKTHSIIAEILVGYIREHLLQLIASNREKNITVGFPELPKRTVRNRIFGEEYFFNYLPCVYAEITF